MQAAFFWIPLLIFLVLGLLNGARGILEARIRRRLRWEGIETEAVVIGHWVMGTPRSGNAYYVKYSYYHQGQLYQREEQVGSSRYKAWPRGTRVPLHYLPQDPFVARIASERNHFLSTAIIMVAFAIFVIVMIALAFL